MYLLLNHERHEIKTSTFPGGEEYVRLPPCDKELVSVTLYAYPKSSTEVMRMFMAIDAMQRLYRAERYVLVMPYLPYARQDRVCSSGEAFSLEVFAKMLNSFSLDIVYVADPHSDVAVRLIHNLRVRSQVEGFTGFTYLNRLTKELKNFAIVSPDAGATKKTAELRRVLPNNPYIQAAKTRDLTTGAITGTVVHADRITQPCLIVDDICDGGRTFVELAKALREKGADTVWLYVTHGIFSKGKEALEGIDNILALYDWTSPELPYTGNTHV